MERIDTLLKIYIELKQYYSSLSYWKFLRFIGYDISFDDRNDDLEIIRDKKKCRRIMLGLEAIPYEIGRYYSENYKSKQSKIDKLSNIMKETFGTYFFDILNEKLSKKFSYILNKEYSDTKIVTMVDLIYVAVAKRYKYNKTISMIVTVKNNKINFKPDSSKLINMKLREQKEEYFKIIEMYPFSNVDQYMALMELADRMNAYACYELGNIYYYGITLKYDMNTHVEIKSDFKMAYEFFIKAMFQGHVASIWALGELYLKNKIVLEENDNLFRKYLYGNFSGITSEENIDIAEALFECSLNIDSNYAPALNSLGIIRLEYYAARYARKETSEKYVFDEKANVYILGALKNFYKAMKQGFVYSINRVAQFLYMPKYEIFINDNKKEISRILNDSNLNPEEYLYKSAVMNNPWAMNRLAYYYYIPQKRYKEARVLLEKAAEYGHSWAMVNLAEIFLKEEDKEKYYHMLNLAALYNNEKAIEILSE